MDDREYLETIVNFLKDVCDRSLLDYEQKRVYKIGVESVLKLYDSGIMRDSAEIDPVDSP